MATGTRVLGTAPVAPGGGPSPAGWHERHDDRPL